MGKERIEGPLMSLPVSDEDRMKTASALGLWLKYYDKYCIKHLKIGGVRYFNWCMTTHNNTNIHFFKWGIKIYQYGKSTTKDEKSVFCIAGTA